MTVATLTLADFLSARIAEDEAAAHRWYAGDGVRVQDGGPLDPARILAECQVKRRIVEAYEKNRTRIEANASDHTKASARGDLSALPTLRSVGWDLGGRDWALEITLRLLALPYADHPDYDPEWAV